MGNKFVDEASSKAANVIGTEWFHGILSAGTADPVESSGTGQSNAFESITSRLNSML